MINHKHNDSITINGVLKSPASRRQHSSVSLPTTANSHQIRIQINKEEDIIEHLTKKHKANMSLLFYDFNNAN